MKHAHVCKTRSTSDLTNLTQSLIHYYNTDVVSTGVIAGTSVVAAFIAVITLLIVVICAGIKIKLRFTIQE